MKLRRVAAAAAAEVESAVIIALFKFGISFGGGGGRSSGTSEGLDGSVGLLTGMIGPRSCDSPVAPPNGAVVVSTIGLLDPNGIWSLGGPSGFGDTDVFDRPGPVDRYDGSSLGSLTPLFQSVLLGCGCMIGTLSCGIGGIIGWLGGGPDGLLGLMLGG